MLPVCGRFFPYLRFALCAIRAWGALSSFANRRSVAPHPIAPGRRVAAKGCRPKRRAILADRKPQWQLSHCQSLCASGPACRRGRRTRRGRTQWLRRGAALETRFVCQGLTVCAGQQPRPRVGRESWLRTCPCPTGHHRRRTYRSLCRAQERCARFRRGAGLSPTPLWRGRIKPWKWRQRRKQCSHTCRENRCQQSGTVLEHCHDRSGSLCNWWCLLFSKLRRWRR